LQQYLLNNKHAYRNNDNSYDLFLEIIPLWILKKKINKIKIKQIKFK